MWRAGNTKRSHYMDNNMPIMQTNVDLILTAALKVSDEPYR